LPISDETRALISASKSGVNNPMFGVSHNPEAILTISATQTGTKHSYKVSEEQRVYWQEVLQYNIEEFLSILFLILIFQL
jgi:hypothetical protein